MTFAKGPNAAWSLKTLLSAPASSNPSEPSTGGGRTTDGPPQQGCASAHPPSNHGSSQRADTRSLDRVLHLNAAQIKCCDPHTLAVSGLDASTNEGLALMDGGANNGLAGSNMVRVSDFHPPGNVSIVDASDSVNSALSDLITRLAQIDETAHLLASCRHGQCRQDRGEWQQVAIAGTTCSSLGSS